MMEVARIKEYIAQSKRSGLQLQDEPIHKQNDILRTIVRNVEFLLECPLDGLLVPFLSFFCHDRSQEGQVHGERKTSLSAVRMAQSVLRLWRVKRQIPSMLCSFDRVMSSADEDTISSWYCPFTEKLAELDASIDSKIASTMSLLSESSVAPSWLKPLGHKEERGERREERGEERDTSISACTARPDSSHLYALKREEESGKYVNLASASLCISPSDVLEVASVSWGEGRGKSGESADLSNHTAVIDPFPSIQSPLSSPLSSPLKQDSSEATSADPIVEGWERGERRGERNEGREGNKKRGFHEISPGLITPRGEKGEGLEKIEELLKEASALSSALKTITNREGREGRGEERGETKKFTTLSSKIMDILRRLSSSILSPLLSDTARRTVSPLSPLPSPTLLHTLLSVGQVYSVLELHKCTPDFLLLVTEQLVSSKNGFTFTSLDVACFCAGTLLPTLRHLRSSASRVFTKAVDPILNSHPEVVICALLMPAVVAPPTPMASSEVTGGTEAATVSTSETLSSPGPGSHQLEFLQRMFRQLTNVEMKNHLITLLFDPLDEHTYLSLGTTCSTIFICTIAARVVEAYLISMRMMLSSYKRDVRVDEAMAMWHDGRFSLHDTVWFRSKDKQILNHHHHQVHVASSSSHHSSPPLTLGLQMDKESLKLIDKLVSTTPSLDALTIETIITGLGEATITQQDSSSCASVGKILHTLVNKHLDKMVNFLREVRSVVEKYAPYHMIAKTALRILDSANAKLNRV